MNTMLEATAQTHWHAKDTRMRQQG